jgi:hypothetical protein
MEEKVKTSAPRRYSKTEFAERGDAIFENVVQQRLRAEEIDHFVAIDIESSEYEVDTDELTACQRLRKRIPAAQIWIVRAGSPFVHRFGGRNSPKGFDSSCFGRVS